MILSLLLRNTEKLHHFNVSENQDLKVGKRRKSVALRNILNNHPNRQWSQHKPHTNWLLRSQYFLFQRNRMFFLNLWLPERKCWGRDRLGVWDWHVHTTIFKIDNQQGPTLLHRECCSIFCNNLNRKIIWKRIHVYV